MDGLLPTVDGPEAAYVRELRLQELQIGLSELPQEQRDMFIAHELEERSFEPLAKLNLLIICAPSGCWCCAVFYLVDFMAMVAGIINGACSAGRK